MKIIQTYSCSTHSIEQQETGKRLDKAVKEIPILENEKSKLVCTFCFIAGIITYADCKIEVEVVES